jgi:hypothetical protein
VSDARLRELERRWKETNSPDDEAAYLLERVRVGDLTRERLELAAYCGHEGASTALGVSHARLPDPSIWIGGLGVHGTASITTAASSLAVAALSTMEKAEETHQGGASVRLALRTAEQSLASGRPCLDLLRGTYISLRNREWKWPYYLDHACQAALQAIAQEANGKRSDAIYALRQALGLMVEAGWTHKDCLLAMTRTVGGSALASRSA